MDDANQNANVKTQIPNNQVDPTTNVAPVQQNPQQPIPQPQQNQGSSTSVQQDEWILPTAASSKEAAPVSAATPEWLAPSTPEVKLSEEVSEAGVEAVSEMPEITKQEKQAGVEPVKEAVVPPTVPAQQSGKYAMTLAQAQAKIKGPIIFKDVSDASYWLAMLLLKHFSRDKDKENQ